MNEFEQAAATWVERRWNYPEGSVSNVDFAIERGGGCETCAYDEPGINFKLNGRREELPLGEVSAGQFIQECVQILEERRAREARPEYTL